MTDEAANRWRGEASITIANAPRLLRPSFSALVAAEEEIGSLFALVDRAAEGQLRIGEIVALFWHCLANRQGLTREMVGDAVLEAGLSACAAPLRILLQQIMQGAA